MSPSIRFLPTALLFMTCAVSAGEFNTQNGLALRGHDPVAYFREGKPVRGDERHRYEYKGATFLFASASSRDAFAAEPDRYAPRYGGYCAYGAAGGYKAEADPAAFAIVEGKLYLNYNAKVQESWRKDTAGYIRKADSRWAEVAATQKVHR